MTETAQQAARRLARSAIRGAFKPEALHCYTDEKGEPIYWRIRARLADGEKWIRPMRRNGNGCELGEPDFSGGKPLYRLHELAVKHGAPCWYVEGESCADALARLGVLATTAGGATSDERADFAPLKGRAMTIWPDNDKAGTEHGERVAKELRALGCSVEVLEVAALGLPERGDCVDWLKSHPGATPADLEVLPRVQRAASAAATELGLHRAPKRAASHEWPAPLPLIAENSAEPYPLDALPGGIGEAVREVVGFVQCPPCLAACSALAALSMAGQAIVDVRRAESLSGPTSLYLLAVAESGERKTTCDGYFSAGLWEWEHECAEAAKPALAEHAAEMQAWEATREGILAAIKQAARTGKATTDDKARLEALERAKPARPSVPSLVHMDSTPEALAHAMALGWPSGGVLSAEAGIVFGGHGMGRDSIMRNLALLNSLWEGGTLKVSRRTSETFTLSGARFTAGLAAQPETVRQFFEQSKGLARGTGFAARFLIAWPESTQGRRPFVEAPPSWPHLAAFSRRIRGLLDVPLPREEGGLRPILLDLTPEAKAAWVDFHNEVERELAPGGELADARDVASKAADNAARMAGLFHLYENGPAGSIGEAHIRAAASIVTWHLLEARRLLGELVLPRAISNAAKLDAWLRDYCRRQRTASIPHRKVRQYGPGPLRDKAALAEALAELEEAARARVDQDGRQKWIRMNPALLGGSDGSA